MMTDVTAAASVPVSSTCTTACQPTTNNKQQQQHYCLYFCADFLLRLLPSKTAIIGCCKIAVHVAAVGIPGAVHSPTAAHP
jgi:hypothetical protein